MPKHDADIRGRLAIVYNGETVTSKTNASNPQVGGPCHTLGATGAGRAVVIENHAKAFSFDSLASNSMKSTNPHSGCREVGVSKTLDATRPRKVGASEYWDDRAVVVRDGEVQL